MEAMRNVQTRVRNLNETSPFDAWKNALDAFIEMLKTSHLDAFTGDELQERRRELNEAKTRLLELLRDPVALYIKTIEARRTNEQ
jgi:hypothetical protein